MEEPKKDDPKAPAEADKAVRNSKLGIEEMHIKVYSPFHVYFDDIAKSISAINETGPFDILPGHRNFMTLISACELVVRTSKNEERIKIARAVMHVKADEVRVFLDV